MKYFSLPESNITIETGILIFANRYNLVTLQCSFFGDEFMQGAENFNLKNGLSEV